MRERNLQLMQQGQAVRVCMHVLGQARSDGRVLREATALLKAGAHVTIVDVESSRSCPTREDIQGISARHVKMPGWFVPTRFKPWFLVKAAQALVRGVIALVCTPTDIYHAHDVTALPACYIASRLRRKPLIYDAHEIPLDAPSTRRWKRLYRLSIGLLHTMIPKCAGIITVSPPIVEEIHQQYGGPVPVLLRNMPDYQPPLVSDQLRRHLDLSAETRIALYQGNLQADRRLDRLVSAARFLAPGMLIVLMGRNLLGDQLERLINQEDVGDRVKILPPVPYKDLLAWTASADVGLIVYDGRYSQNVQMCLPNKLFEYLMAGLPVLASPLDAVAQLLTTYDVGQVVASLEPESIGKAISAILADPAGLARMRRNALAAAERDLRWDVESQRLVQLYQEVLGTQKLSAGVSRADAYSPYSYH